MEHKKLKSNATSLAIQQKRAIMSWGIVSRAILERIIFDAIILQKLNNGWREIHHCLTKTTRYLKDTPFTDIKYEFSNQVKYQFQMTRPYMWLKPIRNCNRSEVRFYGYYDDFEDGYISS